MICLDQNFEDTKRNDNLRSLACKLAPVGMLDSVKTFTWVKEVICLPPFPFSARYAMTATSGASIASIEPNGNCGVTTDCETVIEPYARQLEGHSVNGGGLFAYPGPHVPLSPTPVQLGPTM